MTTEELDEVAVEAAVKAMQLQQWENADYEAHARAALTPSVKGEGSDE